MRPEFSLIVHFAKESDAVDVTLGPPYFEFDTSNKPLSQMLLGYFIAGAVKFDLEDPPLAHDRKADAGAAIRAALVYYREHRRIHPKDTHPLFDKLDALARPSRSLSPRGRLAARTRWTSRDGPDDRQRVELIAERLLNWKAIKGA